MATDVDRLRLGLEDYRQSLNRHLTKLADDIRSVEESWAALDQEYQGHAAEEFRQQWRTTADWFAEYQSALQGMIAMIDHRSPNLRKV